MEFYVKTMDLWIIGIHTLIYSWIKNAQIGMIDLIKMISDKNIVLIKVNLWIIDLN